MKTQEKVTIVLSGLAFILSVITFAIAYTRFEMPDLNTGSFLVSVLAVLVTILIAWQVYTAIKIETIIDKKIKESEDKIEKQSLQRISSIALEFYSHFNVLSYINGMPVLTRLSFLIGGIIYGSLIEDMPKEFLKPYHFLLDNFENVITENKDVITNLSKNEKQIILIKIREYSHIAIFRKLEQILEPDNN